VRRNSCDDNFLVTVRHPTYNPELAPSDFRLFGHVKTSLADGVSNDVDELLEAVVEFLSKIQPSELHLVFRPEIERVT
jgi:hypothetical protein